MNSEYNYFNMIIKPDTEHHSKMEILFLAVHQMKSTIYFEYWNFKDGMGWGQEHVQNILNSILFNICLDCQHIFF